MIDLFFLPAAVGLPVSPEKCHQGAWVVTTLARKQSVGVWQSSSETCWLVRLLDFCLSVENVSSDYLQNIWLIILHELWLCQCFQLWTWIGTNLLTGLVLASVFHPTAPKLWGEVAPQRTHKGNSDGDIWGHHLDYWLETVRFQWLHCIEDVSLWR